MEGVPSRASLGVDTGTKAGTSPFTPAHTSRLPSETISPSLKDPLSLLDVLGGAVLIEIYSPNSCFPESISSFKKKINFI